MHRVIALFAAVGTLALGAWLAVAGAASRAPVVGVSQVSSADTSSQDTPTWHPTIPNTLQFQGARSCSASACHGSEVPDERPGAVGRNEYHIWREHDPHAQANEALTSQLGRQILGRLDAEFGDAQYQNCVACHNPSRWGAPRTADALPSASQYHAAQDGVSCEACHGPAQRWRDRHFRNDWTDADARAAGKVTSGGNLLARARVCADCHVGSKGREVNHDMIAAGHPPLRFEYTAYMDVMPKHWNDENERWATPEFELQSWAAGQIASAEASLELLEARADQTSKQPVWPEFSEYDCFSCHHDMNAGQWRPERAYNSTALAVPQWGDWYFGMLEHMAAQDENNPAAESLSEALAALKAAMNDGYVADRTQVAAAAKNVRARLYEWADSGDTLRRLGTPHRIGEMVRAITKSGNDRAPEGTVAVNSWDEATQVYLALVAADFAERDHLDESGQQPNQEHDAFRQGVRNLRRQLIYPDGYNSPKNFAGALQTSDSSRAAYHGELLLLRDFFEQHEQPEEE